MHAVMRISLGWATYYRVALFVWLGAACGVSAARIVEEVEKVPVTVVDVDGVTIRQDIVVTIFRDDQAPKAPYLILNHGRSTSAKGTASFGRARYPSNARYFVRKGFVVLVPTRIGYGVSGGVDAERSGSCQHRDYRASYRASVEQSRQVLAHFASRPYLDATRGLAVGQSFGGVTAVGLAADRLPGLVASFNFAGGGGGRPSERPGKPCRPDLIEQRFAEYGRTAATPTYWFYGTGDRYWGDQLPREWFDAFRRTGGQGEFFTVRTAPANAHGFFVEETDAWRPTFERILRELPITLGTPGS
jgi:dienelactone hydrolase